MTFNFIQRSAQVLADPKEPLGFLPIFIAGAPRTGTHFIHALLCTSLRTNPFVPECHYIYFLLESYLRARQVFNAAGGAGFADDDSFARHHFAMVRLSLGEMWNSLGRPEILALKHCGFTPVIPVLSRQFPTMKFVVILRDPRDAVASEVRAAQRGNDPPETVPSTINRAISRFKLYYGSVLRAKAMTPDKIHLVRYERIVNGEDMEELRRFAGLDDINPQEIWKRASFDIGAHPESKVYSELWGKPLTSRNVGIYGRTLDAEISSRIWRETETLVMRFDAVAAEANGQKN